MNRVLLYGRITKEHDLRYAPKSGVAYLFNSIAVESYSKKKQKILSHQHMDVSREHQV